mmetsp:Transcript_62729/g.180455  ORF Transcript_62729/g.180455 Transcript_62729/m.180455 type:complete len:282 (+) Transcript_62729:1838-2683(+)
MSFTRASGEVSSRQKFSSFKSLWQTPLRWQYPTAAAICLTQPAASRSVYLPFLQRCPARSGPCILSMTSRSWQGSSKTSSSRQMLGWLSIINWFSTSALTRASCSPTNPSVQSVFTATFDPELLETAVITPPDTPEPRTTLSRSEYFASNAPGSCEKRPKRTPGPTCMYSSTLSPEADCGDLPLADGSGEASSGTSVLGSLSSGKSCTLSNRSVAGTTSMYPPDWSPKMWCKVTDSACSPFGSTRRFGGPSVSHLMREGNDPEASTSTYLKSRAPKGAPLT